jgi:hypothetical protein
MRQWRTIAAAAALLALSGLGTESLGQGGCVSGHEARQILEKGQAAPFPEAFRRAGYSRNQLAGDPQLCQSGGGYVYRVRVVQGGQVSSVTIPAN